MSTIRFYFVPTVGLGRYDEDTDATEVTYPTGNSALDNVIYDEMTSERNPIVGVAEFDVENMIYDDINAEEASFRKSTVAYDKSSNRIILTLEDWNGTDEQLGQIYYGLDINLGGADSWAEGNAFLDGKEAKRFGYDYVELVPTLTHATITSPNGETRRVTYEDLEEKTVSRPKQSNFITTIGADGRPVVSLRR